jgi:hypothetical protein
MCLKTSIDIIKMNFLQIKPKRVFFSDKVRVVLIPSRREYDSWKNTLWYSPTEFAQFVREEIERRTLSNL